MFIIWTQNVKNKQCAESDPESQPTNKCLEYGPKESTKTNTCPECGPQTTTTKQVSEQTKCAVYGSNKPQQQNVQNIGPQSQTTKTMYIIWTQTATHNNKSCYTPNKPKI